MEILIPQRYSPKQVKRAEAKRVEFRHTRYTSGVANLDDMVALGKAVILCDSHSRRFEPKKARYRLHPDPNMRRVIGQCDVCRLHGLSKLFLNERDAYEQQKTLEKFRRTAEYGRFTAS